MRNHRQLTDDVVTARAAARRHLRVRAQRLLACLATGGLVAGLPIVVSRMAGATTSPNAVIAWNNFGVDFAGSLSVPAGLGSVKAVAAGDEFSLAVKDDGTVVGWGQDVGGLSIPSGLTGVVQVVASGFSAMARKADGSVVSWGAPDAVGSAPATLAGVVDVDGTAMFGIAAKSDGSVETWQVPANAVTTTPSPTLTDAVEVAAGESHALIRRANGTVVAWGQDVFGDTVVPAGLTGVVDVAAASAGSFALKADGTIVAWGAPWLVASAGRLSGVVELSGGRRGPVFARMADGTIAIIADDLTTQDFDAHRPAGLAHVQTIEGNASAIGPLHLLAIVDEPFAVSVTATVTGTQTYGGSPAFAQTNDTVNGVTLSGALTCATVDGGTPITAVLATGAHTLDSASCGGLTASDGRFAVSYRAATGSFVVNKAAQTITVVSAPPRNTITGNTYPLMFATTSGLPVTASVRPFSACTLDTALQLTFVDSGGCLIDVTQAGDTNWQAAPPLLLTFESAALPDTFLPDFLNGAVFDQPNVSVILDSTSFLSTFECSTDSEPFQPCTQIPTFTFADGVHTLAARATNSVGTDPTPASATFTVDTAVPTVTITTPAQGAVLPVGAVVTPLFQCTDLTLVSCTGPTTVFTDIEGTFEFTVTATDQALHTTVASVTYTVSAGKTDQTITFGALADRTLLEIPFTVTATATSGGLVTFTSSTPGVCGTAGADGSTITLLIAGSCTIVAHQAGDATHNPAPDVAQSFTISKIAQTISLPPITAKTVTQSGFAVTVTSSSGLPVVLVSTTPAVCSAGPVDATGNAAITLLAAGTCSLTASQPGNAIYLAAPEVAQSFTVTAGTKLSQTISFPAPTSKTIAQSGFTVVVTATSGLPVSLASGTPAVCSAGQVGVGGSTAITLHAPGTCSLTATQSGNAIYNPARAVTRTFKVTKAAQTISFPAIGTKALAQSGFSVTVTASSGLAVTLVSTTPAICTAGPVGPAGSAAITLRAAGTCSLVASQPGNAIYTPAPSVTQKFKVTR